MKPKGYWIVRLDVHDEGRFGEYAAVVQRIMSENGARFLVRGGRSEVMAGPAHVRITVIEFPPPTTTRPFAAPGSRSIWPRSGGATKNARLRG